MKKNKQTKVLAINFGGIGDEILFFPTLTSLKSMFKNAHITLVTEPRSSVAKELTDSIDDIITCDIKGKHKYFNLFRLITQSWGKNFNVVVASGSSPFISLILFLTGIKRRIGYNTGKLSQLLLTKSATLNKNQYAARMYHDLAKIIHNKAELRLPEVIINPDYLRQAAETIGERDRQVILIHPGVSLMSISKNIYKGWSPDNWVELIKRLLETGKYQLLLTGGPDDEMIINKIRADLTKSDACLNRLKDLYGKTKNIQQLAALIELSDIMICVDSAPMHIAVGTKTQLVALFGPTDEEKLLPKDDRFRAVTNKASECRPCLWDKRLKNCPKSLCLNISVDEVFRAINQTL